MIDSIFFYGFVCYCCCATTEVHSDVLIAFLGELNGAIVFLCLVSDFCVEISDPFLDQVYLVQALACGSKHRLGRIKINKRYGLIRNFEIKMGFKLLRVKHQ